MWETRIFLPALLSVSISTHPHEVLPPHAVFGPGLVSSDPAAVDALQHLKAVLRDEAEERSDLYAVMPLSGGLSDRVGLKLRNIKKKVEVKIATEVVALDNSSSSTSHTTPTPAAAASVTIAGRWTKYDTKLKHGFGKPKKVAAFLEETCAPLAVSAAAQLLAAREGHKQKHGKGPADSDSDVDEDVSPFLRFPKFPLPLVVVTKSRRQADATLPVQEGASQRWLNVKVEETSVELSTPTTSVALRSWAVESDDKALVERVGKYWASWVPSLLVGMASSTDGAALASSSVSSVTGVLSYPEVVTNFYAHAVPSSSRL